MSDTHNPCCPDHAYDYPMDCDRFRRTHIVEPGEDCCSAWAARGPQSWVPSGCPAGFSADCYYWTSNGACRCWSPPLATKEPSSEASIKESPDRRFRADGLEKAEAHRRAFEVMDNRFGPCPEES